MKAFHVVPLTAVAAALLTFSTTTPAYSDMKNMPGKSHNAGHGQMMEMGDMDHMDHMWDMTGACIEHADKIGITDEQKQKMTPAHREMQKKQVRFKADLKIAEIELKEIMEVKDFDLEKANASVKKIEGIKTAHHLDMMKGMKEMRTMLTDEQFKKMNKMMPMTAGDKKPSKHLNKKR